MVPEFLSSLGQPGPLPNLDFCRPDPGALADPWAFAGPTRTTWARPDPRLGFLPPVNAPRCQETVFLGRIPVPGVTLARGPVAEFTGNLEGYL